MVQYNDTSVAYIGGNPDTLSDSIDTYNFVTETFEDDTAMIPYNLTHNLCAVIPVGVNGNPTVVISKKFIIHCFTLFSLDKYQYVYGQKPFGRPLSLRCSH